MNKIASYAWYFFLMDYTHGHSGLSDNLVSS